MLTRKVDGRVAPRSGLASKHSIDVGAGVIDADYRGPLKVLLFNFSDTEFKITQHERIAQLVLERIVTPDVAVVEELSSTERGAGGFGSTGGFGEVVASTAQAVSREMNKVMEDISTGNRDSEATVEKNN